MECTDVAAEVDVQMEAYTEAVKSGLYAKKSGLVGKYDNVRKYWEDEITRHYLYPYLMKLIEWKHQKMERLKILDLGCGSADGFELLTGLRFKDANLHDREVDLITDALLGCYKGIDLNEDLLAQAQEIYGGDPKVQFVQGDFTAGLNKVIGEEPYDLYFSSYGTSSHHNEDKTMIDLIAEIAERTQEYSIIVCDWLGRYSYEWQTLWTNNYEERKNMVLSSLWCELVP
jgi:SAM-dependent methyltransferase